jgi:hypothetical protein
MKAKIFYDHLIIIEEVEMILITHQLTKEECEEILQLIDRTMHNEILQKILSHLPRHHHEEFLTRFHAAPHDNKLMTFLKDHTIVDIEKEIMIVADSVKKKVLKEIEAAKISS